MDHQAPVARRLIGSVHASSSSAASNGTGPDCVPSLQDLAFEILIQDQLRLEPGKAYQIVCPGSLLSDVRFVNCVSNILPESAMRTALAQRYASHIVVERAHTPPDMRTMFDHAGKHLLKMAHAALDLLVWYEITVRDALNAKGLEEVGGIHMVVEEARDEDHVEYGPNSYEVRADASSWVRHYSRADSAFEPYMDTLSVTARFTLAVRLWLRVSKLNAHDIVSMVQNRLVRNEDARITLNYIDYSLKDGDVLGSEIEVYLPANDMDIYMDTADSKHVSVHSLAHSLALAYPEEALVPCAIAAGVPPDEAATFVRKIREPHRQKRRVSEER